MQHVQLPIDETFTDEVVKQRVQWELKYVLSDVLKDPDLNLDQSTRDKLTAKLREALEEEGIVI